MVDELSSDHLPILIIIGAEAETPAEEDKTTTDWTVYKQTLENETGPNPIIHHNANFENAILQLQTDMTNAKTKATKVLEQRPTNPATLPPELKELIREKNRLRNEPGSP